MSYLKSNRSGGDYSELMVLKNLQEAIGQKFTHSKDLKEVTQKMLSLPQGREKKKLQDRNIPLLIKGVLAVIKLQTGSTNYSLVSWVGRSKKSGLEDLVVSTKNENVKISLKSLNKEGSGTLKNTGSRTLKVLGVDYSQEYAQMKLAVRKGLSKRFPELKISTTSPSSYVKACARKDSKVEAFAEQISCEFIKAINSKIAKTIKSLSFEELKSFLNQKVFGGKDPVWVVIASNGSLRYYNQQASGKIKTKDLLTVEKVSDRSYRIYKNKRPFLRANTCCTNGKGLSAVCQRYFFESEE